MQDLERFGGIVRARREDLGIQQEDMDDHGGPSSTTMSRIERGLGEPSPKTLRKLDKGLRWQSGSAKRTLEGGVPTELEPGYDRPPARWVFSEDAGWFQQILHSAKVLIEFAIDADAVDSQAAGVDSEFGKVEQFKEQVTRLLVDIDRLTQRIHDEANDEIGDPKLLRAIKNDVLRRRRLERLGTTDSSDDLLTEFFRFAQSEDSRGLEGDEVPQRFFELIEAKRVSLDESEPGSAAALDAGAVLESVGNDRGVENTVNGH